MFILPIYGRAWGLFFLGGGEQSYPDFMPTVTCPPKSNHVSSRSKLFKLVKNLDKQLATS